MHLIDPSLWPLWCGCGLLLLAALINARSLAVPNRLSLSALVGGWLAAIAVSASVGGPTRGGGILPSVAATAVALLLLLPFYRSGWLGAGCVKMQMAFGAWVGCALNLPSAVLVTGLTTMIGELVTALAAASAAVRFRSADRGDAETFLIPAQIPLSLGSLGGVITAGLLGWI
jgi:prepilin peptidase CpaA